MSVSLSLMEACMVETLLKKGMDANTIVNHVHNGDVQILNDFDNTFDYSYLIEENESNSEKLSSALNKSYKIKFVTKNGLKTLLQTKFGLEEKRDYNIVNSQFTLFSINQEQITTLENLLSSNWEIKTSGKTNDEYAKVTIFNPLAE